jgi:hypothetical protein
MFAKQIIQGNRKQLTIIRCSFKIISHLNIFMMRHSAFKTRFINYHLIQLIKKNFYFILFYFILFYFIISGISVKSWREMSFFVLFVCEISFKMFIRDHFFIQYMHQSNLYLLIKSSILCSFKDDNKF